MKNADVAAVFDAIADILEIQGENAFRIRSYRQAARTIGDLTEPLSDLVAEGKDLKALPGIGESLAAKIHDILETGTCQTLEDLKKTVPPHLPDLLGVKGLGAKRVKALYEQLKVTSLEELKAAAEAGKIRDLPGMGEKTEENILKGLATLAAEAGRISIKDADQEAEAILRHLAAVKAIKRSEPAGSFRRRRETIGDLDILVEASDRAKAADGIAACPGVAEVLARGEEKVVVRLSSGLEVDFRFFEEASFGAAMMYFTGSKVHNIALRKRAQKEGWKLNEYGLFEGEKRIAGRAEEDIFKKLGLPWIAPELREDRGEIDAAEQGALPTLIQPRDIRGELHCHTDSSDGHHTLQEMVEAARARKYQYLAITDHSKAVTVAHGLDAARMRRQADRIREVAAGLKDLRLLAGVEVDILKDGRLDLPEKVLADLDWVVASVHSIFNLDEGAMTARLLAAIGSGVVHCLGHPFGRLIGKRDPIQFDADRVFAACAENGVCLEINSYPDRLDLPDTYCRRARDMGCTMAITTDAHKIPDFDFVKYGVWVARRGWLRKGDVLNTLSASALAKRLAKRV